MTAFPKFDPWAESRNRNPTPAKVAKVAKVTKDQGQLSQVSQLAQPSTQDSQERTSTPQATSAPREWAAGYARMVSMPTPAGVPDRHRTELVAATGRFLEEWAGKAAALSWDTEAIFGCHRSKPYVRLECQGLGWLLVGREITALTADTATLRTKSGAIQTYRRLAPGKGGAEETLVWKLGNFADDVVDEGERAAIQQIDGGGVF